MEFLKKIYLLLFTCLGVIYSFSVHLVVIENNITWLTYQSLHLINTLTLPSSWIKVTFFLHHTLDVCYCISRFLLSFKNFTFYLLRPHSLILLGSSKDEMPDHRISWDFAARATHHKLGSIRLTKSYGVLDSIMAHYHIEILHLLLDTSNARGHE